MPTYRVTDPSTGKTLKLKGDSPPTEQELEEIFASVGAPAAEAAPPAGSTDIADSGFLGTLKSVGRDAARGFGLAARDVIQGAGAIPFALTDAAGGLALGDDYRPVSQTLTDAGMPKSETAAERVVSAVGQGAASAASGVGVGNALLRSGSGGARAAGAFLAENPLAQLVGGGSAGASGQVAQELGASPAVQAGASVVGGLAGGMAAMPKSGPAPLRQRIEPSFGDDAARVTGVAQVTPEVLSTAQRGAATIGLDFNALDDALRDRIISTAAKAAQVGSDLPPEAIARKALYESLGLKPTRALVTRDFADALTEGNLLTEVEGKALRDVYIANNQAIRQQIRGLAPEGVQAVDAPTFGQRFRDPIIAGERGAQDFTNKVYKMAEAKEGGNLANVQPVIDYLQSNINSLNATDYGRPVLGYLKDIGVLDAKNMKVISTPNATQAKGLGYVAPPINLRELSGLRQVVNEAAGNAQGPAKAQLAQLKALVNEAEEAAGGEMYKYYRKIRTAKGGAYENNPLIDQLIRDKNGYRGTKLIEDSQVFDKAVLGSTSEQFANVWPRLTPDAKKLTRTQVARYIEDMAYSNMGTNEAGDVVASAAKLNQAINKISAQKLELIYGKELGAKIKRLNTALREISNPPKGTTPQGSAPKLSFIRDSLIKTLSRTTGIPLAGDATQSVVNMVERGAQTKLNKQQAQAALELLAAKPEPALRRNGRALLQLAAPVGIATSQQD